MSARDNLVDLIESAVDDAIYNAGAPAFLAGIAARDAADAIIAAGYVKTEPEWLDTIRNDGTYEYTSTSDCRGENVVHYRRKPGKTYHEQPHSWERYEP